MKRIMVTGASGLLGINLALRASENDHVVGVTYSQSLQGVPFEVVMADLTDELEIDKTIEQANPDLIINCAAMANLDACEKSPLAAQRLNSALPARLAEWSHKEKIPFVHISTDAIFDGVKGNYREDDNPNPLSVYAHMKLDAEHAVLEQCSEALIVRVNFYGFSVSGTRSLAEFFLYNLAAGLSMNGFTDVLFCPLLVQDLVEILLKMIQKNLTGIYHVVSPQRLTKYEFGVAIARIFDLNESLIIPTGVEQGGLQAKRSQNLTLCIDKLIQDLGETPPDLQAGLNKFRQLFQEGYPQKLRAFSGEID